MRRIIPILLGIALPLSVSAAALSPWMDTVVSRIDTGINFARSPFASTVECTNDIVQNEKEQNRSLIAASLSKDDIGALEQLFLRSRTVCLESDRRILQEKIRDILDQLRTATQDCNQQSIKILHDVYSFAIESYSVFLRGALDPQYQNNFLHYTYNFESSEEWSGARPPRYNTGSTLPLCPFTSDYVEPSILKITLNTEPEPVLSRVGCDEDVLGNLPVSMRSEWEPLQIFMDSARLFAESITSTVREALRTLKPSDEPSDIGPRPPLEHRVLSGCQALPLPDESEEPLSEQEDLIWQRFSQTGSTISPKQPSLSSIIVTPLLDGFSLTNDSISLLQTLNTEMKIVGRERPFPASMIEDLLSQLQLTYITTQDDAAYLQDVSVSSDQETSILDSFSRNALEIQRQGNAEFDDALQGLQRVTQDILPKKYIPSLTYFLLRSCIDGSCQKTLESVAERSFNEYCHPYASGKYTDPDAVDKCYCTDEFKNKPFCKGEVDTQSQPEAELQCGEKEE
jgi:hypothetical protein